MHMIKRIFLPALLAGSLIGLTLTGSAEDDKNKKNNEKTKKAEKVVRDITPADPPHASTGTTHSNPTLQPSTKRTPKKKKEPPPPSNR